MYLRRKNVDLANIILALICILRESVLYGFLLGAAYWSETCDCCILLAIFTCLFCFLLLKKTEATNLDVKD